jgi:hypothetical protein
VDVGDEGDAPHAAMRSRKTKPSRSTTSPVVQAIGEAKITATARDRTFRFRDVGADVIQIKPDGTLVLLISGQVPFAFAGVLKINPETEEVILEPRDRSEEQLAKACGVLTGG